MRSIRELSRRKTFWHVSVPKNTFSLQRPSTRQWMLKLKTAAGVLCKFASRSCCTEVNYLDEEVGVKNADVPYYFLKKEP